MFSAAVVSGDSASSGQLRACLQQTGLVASVVEWNISNKDPRPLGSGQPFPDILLLDLPREVEPYFAFAAHHRRLHPDVRIIACAAVAQPEPELLLRAMRNGVQEFLIKPLEPSSVQEILSRFLREHSGTEEKAAEKVVVVMGSKGGVGTSTVAVNLSVQLAQVSKKRVVLLDFARPVGHVALLLDLPARFSLRDAVENLERLDGHFFGGLLTRHKTGLEVLAGVGRAEDWQRIPIPVLARVINLAQSIFDFVVVDFGSHYAPEWNSILRPAKMILLVAESNVPSLWTLERQYSSTVGLGLDPERVRIVINRWSRSDDQVLRGVEKNIKRPIFARLPNDYRQVSEAINLGVPLSKNHQNPLVAEFRMLAGRLAGVPVNGASARGALSNLFPGRLVR